MDLLKLKSKDNITFQKLQKFSDYFHIDSHINKIFANFVNLLDLNYFLNLQLQSDE